MIVESHCNPDCAWSDASQQITPDVLDYVLNLLVIRDVNQTTENLTALRRQIDGIDEQLLELLAKRMRISREIGVYKKSTICQSCNHRATAKFWKAFQYG